MLGLQPSIPPLPSDLSFDGKTALVTGANVGLGLSTCLHLLQHRLSTLLISVRSTSKGLSTKSHLLADPIVESLAVQPTILIYEAEFSDLMFQVNFASTALLAILLLPLLKRSSSTLSSNEPARLTFVGSSAHSMSSFINRATTLASSDKPLFAQLSELASSTMNARRYADSKILIYMFARQLARRVDVESGSGNRGVVINDMCPGMVTTSIDRTVPAWSTPLVWLFKGWRARTAEEGGRIVVYAAAVVGKESHGEFLAHEKITRTKALQFIETQDGALNEKRVNIDFLRL